MRVPWPTLIVLGGAGVLFSGFIMSAFKPPTTAAVGQGAPTIATTPAPVATFTPPPTTTHTPAPPTMDPWLATAASAAETARVAAANAEGTAVTSARMTADANAAVAAAWTNEAVADADRLRNAQIDAANIANAETAWALTMAPADATAAAPSTLVAIANAMATADRSMVVGREQDRRNDMVADWWTIGLAVAAILTPIALAASVGWVIPGAMANRIAAEADAARIVANAEADAIRAQAGIAAPTRDVPVNPNTESETVLVDVDQWRPRLAAFVQQSILLSPGAGPAATTVTPANHEGWNSRAEWAACVGEMARRGWVVRQPGQGGGTTLTGGRTMGELAKLLTMSTLPQSPHPVEA